MSGVLVLQEAWNPFVQRAEAGERMVPRFCRREVEGFLRCRILGYGFARVHCDACKKDCVVAFSCKGRGFCPSCGTRRMVETAAWSVDRPMVVRAGVLKTPAVAGMVERWVPGGPGRWLSDLLPGARLLWGAGARGVHRGEVQAAPGAGSDPLFWNSPGQTRKARPHARSTSSHR